MSGSAGVSKEGLARNPRDGDPARNELAGESWMAERVENVGAPVNPGPLLPPRPMPPRPADLLPPRNGAPASPGTDEAAAGTGPVRTEPRQPLVRRGVSLTVDIQTSERAR